MESLHPPPTEENIKEESLHPPPTEENIKVESLHPPPTEENSARNHALAALQATGYDKGSAFAFLNPRAPLSRPYFGAVPLSPTESAANFSLNGDGDATVVTVDEGTLGELAAKVVKLREQGKTVMLERAEATPDPDAPDAVE